ncbi:hypothetical protein IE81DRAFT_112911 [Ceraceosorus guamensis]|uniref:Uncharacterized protein n=1 Tax=Ceraceosorus guamensis TaxID=1522189 RepID=A0A316VYL1_9BASI|nr:hypothetical protein IE81DRAFT_112911 [Ceraceosorus guamensis]PWN42726.1 hypothetical protein IE81DRAFT_112911 [Ceraceosorus guamensis]
MLARLGRIRERHGSQAEVSIQHLVASFGPCKLRKATQYCTCTVIAIRTIEQKIVLPIETNDSHFGNCALDKSRTNFVPGKTLWVVERRVQLLYRIQRSLCEGQCEWSTILSAQASRIQEWVTCLKDALRHPKGLDVVGVSAPGLQFCPLPPFGCCCRRLC